MLGPEEDGEGDVDTATQGGEGDEAGEGGSGGTEGA